jgi:hypothetical protein
MSEKIIENDKIKLIISTNEKSTQVFTHEHLICRMRQLKSHNPSNRKTVIAQNINENKKITKNNFIKTDSKSIFYRNVLTQSHSDMMNLTEKKIFNFLDKSKYKIK